MVYFGVIMPVAFLIGNLESFNVLQQFLLFRLFRKTENIATSDFIQGCIVLQLQIINFSFIITRVVWIRLVVGTIIAKEAL